MSHPLKVSARDIEQLDDKQLTILLRDLLRNETQKNQIPTSAQYVSLDINIPDGGEDGHVKWSGVPVKTDWLPSSNSLFQVKATNMGPSKCREEIIGSKGSLKSKVREIFELDGDYVLFNNFGMNSVMIEDRIVEMRDGLKSISHPKADTVKIHIYDSNKIAEWANCFTALAVGILQTLGKSRPQGAMTWGEWEGYEKTPFQFVLEQSTEKHISQIRAELSGQKKIVRMLGLSGLGKTRLALEAFRPTTFPGSTETIELLKSRVIFIDAANGTDNLVTSVQNWINEGHDCILVIDNCELRLHRSLEKVMRHSNNQMSLLTLDFHPDERTLEHFGHPVIVLDRCLDETIGKILKQTFESLKESDLRRIVAFADGFPQMAVLLANSRLNEEVDIGMLKNGELAEKLLWGRDPQNPEALSVVTACALFENVGFLENYKSQREFIAAHICKIHDIDFYKHATDFISRKVLDVRGHFVAVRPLPLAIRLAASWWKHIPPERAKELIELVPEDLTSALCNQMAKLDALPEARSLTADLCGPQGPFGQAEILTSKKGSRFFRSLVEINPEATAQAIARVSLQFSHEELLNEKEGRRDIIFALEKLCFWKSTFSIVAPVLMRFAAAENETWSNNATGQFRQLFHYLLSGTQAEPMQRIAVLDSVMSSGSLELKKIGILALGSGLKTTYFSRTGGAEAQGGKAPQEEWRPKKWGEVFDYWDALLLRLTNFAVGEGQLSELARDNIASNLRGLIGHGRIGSIDASISKVISVHGSYWPKAKSQIKTSLKYDVKSMQPETQLIIVKWLSLLEPNTLKDKILAVVSDFADEFEDDYDSAATKIEMRIETLVRELVSSKENWMSILSFVLIGSQPQGFMFGKVLAKHTQDPKFLTLFLINLLSSIEKEKRNTSVLAGVLNEVFRTQPEFVRDQLNAVSERDDVRGEIVNLTLAIEFTSSDINRIWKLIELKKLPASSLYQIGYGQALSKISFEEIKVLVRKLNKLGPDGSSVSLSLLYMSTLRDELRWVHLEDVMAETLLSPEIFQKLESIHLHHWQEATLKIIKQKRNIEFSYLLMKFIIVETGKSSFTLSASEVVEPVLKLLLSEYLPQVWPPLEQALFEKSPLQERRFFNLFYDKSFEGNSDGPFGELSIGFLSQWCEKNPARAPQIVTQFAPLFDKCGDWHPISKYLLDKFGDQDEILNIMSQKMNSFGWSGSAVTPYLARLHLMEGLLNHSKSKVRSWARDYAEYFRKNIEREKKRDEEHKAGIMT